MSGRSRGYLQLVVFFVFVAVLIRFFPVVARIMAAGALGVRQFWWAILIIALGVYSIWVLRRKRPHEPPRD